ncbi:MAG: HAD family phosphatase [Flavobacteriaceae bacterium]|nr:HAD family phosphatase [Flavobacteriaceae bacterium]
MNLENIKLVITDMDGTLLNSKHEVSSKFLNQFKKLQQLGVLFVVASGRPFYSIKDKLNTIKKDIIIVAENGGIVADSSKILASKSMSMDVVKAIAHAIDTFQDIITIYCTKNKAYIKQTSEENINQVKEFYSNYELINSASEINNEVVKIALYHERSSETYIYPYVKKFNTENKVIISSPNWVDISVEGINKGNALRLIQEKYSITKSETLAFGDYNNDLEMLQEATFSFAMENAHEDVKSIAKYNTTSNNDFGVERILDTLITQKTNYQKQ